MRLARLSMIGAGLALAANAEMPHRTAADFLALVAERENMTPWRQTSPPELQAWLARGIRFDSSDDALVAKFYYAKLVLLANQIQEGIYDRPYVVEGGVYHGMWFESVPATMQVFARLDLPLAKEQLRQFVRYQMPDGYLPYKIIPKGPGERSIGYGWIAFAAWHLAQYDDDLTYLRAVYPALTRWIEWMGRYRDANRNGIYEAWSPGDMGHDFSARFQGLPLHVDNLRVPPKGTPTPYDAPDVSALMHLEMLSLGEIADLLGEPAEARQWRNRARALRGRVNRELWDERAESYFDRDSRGKFVRMVGEVLLRPLNGGLPDEARAKRIFERHVLNREEFWTPCPLPSFALNEPLATPGKANTWSGPTMGLTNLRAPYGFQHYGRDAELREVLRRFLAAVVRQRDTFQQYHPVTGEGGAAHEVLLYSPTAAVVLDGVARLYGILPRGTNLEWRAALPPGAQFSRFEFDLQGITFRLECRPATCTAYRDGRKLFSAVPETTIHTDRGGVRIPLSAVRDFPRE